MVFINKDAISQMVTYILTGDDRRPDEYENTREELSEQRCEEKKLEEEAVV